MLVKSLHEQVRVGIRKIKNVDDAGEESLHAHQPQLPFAELPRHLDQDRDATGIDESNVGAVHDKVVTLARRLAENLRETIAGTQIHIPNDVRHWGSTVPATRVKERG